MLPRLVFSMRTADRSPKRNYLAVSIKSLANGIEDPTRRIHVFPNDRNIDWLYAELLYQPCTIHQPIFRYNPNENGVRAIECLDHVAADWLVMLEDDIECCADPMNSMARWLQDHARSDIHVYRFCALPGSPLYLGGKYFSMSPLREMRGSQAVALRADDARDFASWAKAHPLDWRPKDAPFQDRPERGFDKLIGYWALQRWPEQRYGLVSKPQLVRHVGVESALHSRGLRTDKEFAGAGWWYGEPLI